MARSKSKRKTALFVPSNQRQNLNSPSNNSSQMEEQIKYGRMKELIDVVNKLQDVFATNVGIGTLEQEIQLPQIVVIGAQSAGKSSVLEGIVRPLNDEDWAQFGHNEDIYTDFEEVRIEIEEDTERAAGDNKGICDTPIMLTVYSHRVVNLSLVDLPGITKVPVGDQPADIEDQIREMILNYIENPNSLILAVTPANQDFANSDALKLAKEVDPEGERTLAVITKLDLMDQGTDAMDVLMGRVIPVKLGIVGIVSRSQADINNNKSIVDCITSEQNFLSSHYLSIASRNGIEHLAKRLSKMLMEHIRKCMPELKDRVDNKIKQCEKELEALGAPVIDPLSTFLGLINRFVNAYNETIEGCVSQQDDDMKTKNGGLLGGAKIAYLIHNEFGAELEKLDPVSHLTNDKIHAAILSCMGLRPILLVPEQCFEQLVRREIHRLEKPSLNCVDKVYDEMKKAVHYCDPDLQLELNRFPRLKVQIGRVVVNMITECLKQAHEAVRNELAYHHYYINTRHPGFASEAELLKVLKMEDPNEPKVSYRPFGPHQVPIGNINGANVYAAQNDEEEEDQAQRGAEMVEMTGRDKKNCALIRRLIKKYFEIVRQTILDVVPKSINYWIVKQMHDKMQIQLQKQLYQQQVEELLNEDEGVQMKRASLQNRLKTLEKAADVLNEIQDSACF